MNQSWSRMNQSWSKMNQPWSKINQSWSKMNQSWSKMTQSWCKMNQSWSKMTRSWCKMNQSWSKMTQLSLPLSLIIISELSKESLLPPDFLSWLVLLLVPIYSKNVCNFLLKIIFWLIKKWSHFIINPDPGFESRTDLIRNIVDSD